MGNGGESLSKMQAALSNFLLTYHSNTTGRTPAELFLKREIRTRFNLLRPNLQEKVMNRQADYKQTHDKSPQIRYRSRSDGR